MPAFFKSLLLLLVTVGFIGSFSAFRYGDEKPVLNTHATYKYDGDKSSCRRTAQGPVIDWKSNYRLKYEDFKAEFKRNAGFVVATTSTAFGYSIADNGGEISGSIFVRFYCEESWWNPDFVLDEVLHHEQLHFDICELFGRRLYKEVLVLRDGGRLNKRTIQRLHTKFEKRYANYQNLYDKQTDHSANGDEQRKWNEKIKNELDDLSEYAGYHSF